MSILDGFSEPIELPSIPDKAGVVILQDQQWKVLEVVESTSIRRRVGELLDSSGGLASKGPKVHEAHRTGIRILIRWKLPPDHKAEKKRFVKQLDELWGGKSQQRRILANGPPATYDHGSLAEL